MNRTKKILLTIFFLTLIPRIFILVNSSLTFYSDDAIYAMLARFLVEGKWQYFFHPTWPPLYPAFSSLIFLFVKNWEVTLRIVSVIAGSLLVIPLFFLIKKTLSFTHAILFTTTITFFSPIFKLSLLPLSDMLASLLIVSFITSIFLGIYLKQSSLFILGAIFSGLTYLTRSEGLLLFLITLLYLFFYFLFQIFVRNTIRFREIIILPLYIGLFFLIISPSTVATRIQLGSWTLSQKFSAQIQQSHAFALNKNGTTWSQEVVSVKSPNYKSSYFKGGISHILNYDDWFFWWFLQKAKKWFELFLELFPLWSIVIMTFGILNLVRKEFFWSLGYMIFIMVIAIPTTIFSTAVSDIRYLLWAFPLFVYLFYLGINFMFQLPKKSPRIIKSKIGLIIAFVPFIASLFFPSFSWNSLLHPISLAKEFTKNHERKEIQEAGLWIREHSPTKNLRIMMRHEGVEFYAKGETIYSPQISYEELIRYAKEHKVDYIVAWTEELTADPNLSILLAEDAELTGLVKLHSIKEDRRILLIYKLAEE